MSSEQTEATTAAPVDNGQAPPVKPRRQAAPKAEPISLGPAAESGAAAGASSGPCAECAEQERGFEERLGRLEQAHAALAKLTAAALIAGVVIYVLAGREGAKEVTG